MRRATPLLLLLPVALVLAACTETERTLVPGARVEVMATWSGEEQERFSLVLREFERRTGAQVAYVSAGGRLPAVLAQRLDRARPPDVAFLPQPGLLRELAASGRLLPLDAPTTRAVEAHFPRTFRDLASYAGQEYGVWFKAANKSLVWYDVATFERLGLVPPRDLDGLRRTVGVLSAAGLRSFAVSGGSGWTLTDWFENVHVRVAGREAYDALAAHRTPWTDPSVVRTLRLLGELLAPEAVAGGTAVATTADFADSVQAVFGRPSRAAMVMEGDFVASVVAADTRAVLGVDADVFPFPAGGDGAPVVVGGGDVAVQLRSSEAAAALLAFLATPEAAAVWASAGGFLSPNLDLDLGAYPDDVTRGVARRLLEAGDDFRFDLSDLQPSAFGGSETTGMFAELRAFLRTRDAAGTAARLEAAATAAGAGAS